MTNQDMLQEKAAFLREQFRKEQEKQDEMKRKEEENQGNSLRLSFMQDFTELTRLIQGSNATITAIVDSIAVSNGKKIFISQGNNKAEIILDAVEKGKNIWKYNGKEYRPATSSREIGGPSNRRDEELLIVEIADAFSAKKQAFKTPSVEPIRARRQTKKF